MRPSLKRNARASVLIVVLLTRNRDDSGLIRQLPGRRSALSVPVGRNAQVVPHYWKTVVPNLLTATLAAAFLAAFVPWAPACLVIPLTAATLMYVWASIPNELHDQPQKSCRQVPKALEQRFHSGALQSIGSRIYCYSPARSAGEPLFGT
jgi:hypothetical protein